MTDVTRPTTAAGLVAVLRDRLLWLAMAVALIFRLVALAALPELTFPDTSAYLNMGRALLDAELSTNEKYMPLFSIYAAGLGGGMWLKLVDTLVSVMTVPLIYALGRAIFACRSAALLAAFAAAVYPHFIFYSIARLTETTYLFVTCAAFLLFYRRAFFWGSVVLVLSILIRPTVDFLAPILVAVFALVVWRESLPRVAGRMGVYLLVYVVLMTPWWVHNYQKYDTFVRLNLGDGVVLYSGNNPVNTSGGGVSRNADDRDMNLDRFDQYGDPLVRNEKMKRAAYDFILENPGRFVELAGIKFIRFWRLWPYAKEYSKPHIVAASLLSFGVVVLLSLVFLVRFGIVHWRAMAPIYMFALFLTAVHMVTIGSIRYRLPVEPFMLVAASFAAVWLLRKLTIGRRLLARLDAGYRPGN